VVEEPTAQQSDAEVHVTLERTLLCPVTGSGELDTAQEFPSQRSIRVCPPLDPTAQHWDADRHVTPERAPLVMGEVAMIQEFPSQRSINVRLVLL
jgi:hypothetical protein